DRRRVECRGARIAVARIQQAGRGVDPGSHQRRRSARQDRARHPPLASQPRDAFHFTHREEADMSTDSLAPVAPSRVFVAILLRDLTVARRELPYFLVRTAL